MTNKIEAIIFDMDGVIIDSEGLWKKAEKEVYASVGIKLSDELFMLTETMTTKEVSKFWFERQPWTNKTLEEVENGVIERVAQLISEEGKAIDGVEKLVKKLKSLGYKIGLATNSPSILISAVLKKIEIEEYFDAVSSSENELEGKPNPSVYMTVAKKLNCKPQSCVAIEDSYSGLLAAKKAGMKAIVISTELFENNKYKIADYEITNYDQFDISFLN